MRWQPVAVAILCLFAGVRESGAQSTRPEDLGAGKLLVASADLLDPNFAKTVVLLVQYDDDSVVGLVVNRRSKVPVSRVLDTVAGSRGRPESVYAGGPVGTTDVLALVRGGRGTAGTKKVTGDVFLAATRESIEKTFASAPEAGTIHVYLGYAGWTAAQLENEVNLGAWYIFPGNAKTVFDGDPESLWPRLIRQTEMRIARR